MRLMKLLLVLFGFIFIETFLYVLIGHLGNKYFPTFGGGLLTGSTIVIVYYNISFKRADWLEVFIRWAKSDGGK